MILEYEWNEKDLKKELNKKRLIPNIMFLIIGIILYVYVMFFGIKSELFDNKVILIYGIIYTVILGLALFISTKLYVLISLKKNKKNNSYGLYKVNIDDSHIIVEINDNKIEYKYKDIIKYKKKKNYIYIRTIEDKIGLVFKKNVLGNDAYERLNKYLEKNILI